jgi:hypothetical protein
MKKSTSVEISVDLLAEVCDRVGIYGRAAAFIAASALQDAGIVNADDTSKVIDRSKIRRARKRARSNPSIDELVKEPKEFHSIYFDGRHDKTLTHEKSDTSSLTHQRTITEEHIAILSEPNSHYVGHVTPNSGSAKYIVLTMTTFFEQKNINTDNVLAVGCDGTPVNTGSKGGATHLIEVHFGRPLQWIVCLLHANELPLRHLIADVDGKTTEPLGFTGPIGKQLNDCDTKPVVRYDAIASKGITVDEDDLSTDQTYLLEIYRAFKTGVCPVIS